MLARFVRFESPLAFLPLRSPPPVAYEYRVLSDLNLLLITGHDVVTSSEVHRVVTGFQRDPKWNPSMPMLVDWRGVTDLQIDLDEVTKLAEEALSPEQLSRGAPLGPRAAVVLAHHQHASVPMMYHTHLRKSGLKAKIFFSLDEAASWLGIEPEALEQ